MAGDSSAAGWQYGKQRLPCLQDDGLAPRAVDALKQWWPPLNLHRVIAHNPPTLEQWIGFGTHILRDNSLEPRLRELAIMAVAWKTQAPYEWGRHAAISLRIGITVAELDRIAAGPDASGWTALEAAIIRGAFELLDHSAIADTTYAVLEAHLSAAQLMDYVFVIGEFVLVAFVANTFRIQIEPGFPELPERKDA